jgi:hypothetical protein
MTLADAALIADAFASPLPRKVPMNPTSPGHAAVVAAAAAEPDVPDVSEVTQFLKALGGSLMREPAVGEVASVTWRSLFAAVAAAGIIARRTSMIDPASVASYAFKVADQMEGLRVDRAAASPKQEAVADSTEPQAEEFHDNDPDGLG